ncbi:hypothetical protein [Undibacterium sp. Ren11W]|uniref:hypothetical protein n=1 Tax=Undibacterium sp. Ren11W TaxID=3413045 RepID=UPI003BF3C1BE
MASTDIKRAPLSALLGTAGASLSSAQADLGIGVGVASGMLMSDATLEIKAAISRTGNGELEIEPLSSAHLSGALNASAVSTIRVNFVATASAPAVGAANTPAHPPVRSREEIIKIFRERDDLQRLEKIMGELDIHASYLSENQRWLLKASDSSGRLIREQLIMD